MKILEFEVEGFRSLKHVVWKPGDLNVLIGPNGGGKSNVLRALELLAKSAKGELQPTINSWGGLYRLSWNNAYSQVNLRVVSQVFFKLPKRSAVQACEYFFSLSPFADGADFLVWDERLTSGYASATSLKLQKRQHLIEREANAVQVAYVLPRAKQPAREGVPVRETMLSRAGPSFKVNPLVRRQQEDFASTRTYQSFDIGPNSPARRASVASRGDCLEPDGGNLVPVLHTFYSEDRDFKRNVDAALQAAFPDEYEELVFSPAGDNTIQLRIAWKSLTKPQPAADLSDGTIRFLMLMTALLQPTSRSPILIDEPETGLHPRMMRIIAEHAVEAAQHKQIIFATHSPEFLAAFRDAVPTTTVVTCENGETKLRVLDPERLRYWVKEYSLGELFVSGELENMA